MILFVQLVFLVENIFIDFINLFLSHVSHVLIDFTSGSSEFIELVLELFVGLDDFINLFERLLILGLEVD